LERREFLLDVAPNLSPDGTELRNAEMPVASSVSA
jgi:hypothetical protein